jgi:xanthine dehydrogenase accessory factor
VRPEVLQLAAELSRRGEPFVLATVVNREPPISARVGDMAVVTRDGEFHGWIGGSCTRPTVLAEAARALEDGRPRLIALSPEPEARRRPGLSIFPMTCHSGGSVEIYVQPVLPTPRLLVFGVSPIARAVARLGKAVGYRVQAVDPAADPETFPGVEVVTDPQAPALHVDQAAGPSPVFAVVATQGQWDEEALLTALAGHPQYLGVVASPKRFAEMREILAGRADAAALAAVRNPAGLDLGAQEPEEIALSILAEIVKQRRATVRPGRALPMAAPASALDPVCGMTVTIAGAAHKAEHQGRDYYFCCAGCRERFLAAPDRYLPAVTS